MSVENNCPFCESYSEALEIALHDRKQFHELLHDHKSTERTALALLLEVYPAIECELNVVGSFSSLPMVRLQKNLKEFLKLE